MRCALNYAGKFGSLESGFHSGDQFNIDSFSPVGRGDSVTIPDAQNVIANYPIATLTSSANKPVSKAFIASRNRLVSTSVSA